MYIYTGKSSGIFTYFRKHKKFKHLKKIIHNFSVIFLHLTISISIYS